ncbi:hypothetical protein ACFOEK_18265 [Litoribrevibacter euphylliae]|uniref:Globin n=1 Tax=Litoribrevibacter euphylliae TaxID=1834034 RepID=A0ABV7HK03_9GAMM
MTCNPSIIKRWRKHYRTLARDFPPDVKAAWVDAYTIIAGVMQGGANSPHANEE